MKKMYPALVAIILILLMSCSRRPATPVETAATSEGYDYRNYSEVLTACVDNYGAIDYEGVRRDREKLRSFVSALGQVDLRKLPSDEARLAFWINGYNALVLSDAVDLVYQKVEDVRRAAGFFDQRRHRLAGEDLTLEEVTRKAAASNDPRVHFALSCPTISCPRLRTEPFTGAQLDQQLTRCTRAFLGDQGRGLRYDTVNNRVFLSQLFKWYASDFLDKKAVPAEPDPAIMFAAAKRFLPPDVNSFFSQKQPEAKFMEYNWSLNARIAARSGSPAAPKPSLQ